MDDIEEFSSLDGGEVEAGDHASKAGVVDDAVFHFYGSMMGEGVVYSYVGVSW